MRKFSSVLLIFLVSCSSTSGPGYKFLPHGLKLQWPVKRARITRGYKQSVFRNSRHEGIDLAARKGSAILAAHSGRVIFAGRRYSGYGKMIIIENKPWASLYAHLNKIHVKTGQSVKRGQRIGDMGSTGRSSGVHLHFELILDKKTLDPFIYLK